MNSAISIILQMTATLLMGAQHNDQMSLAAKKQLVTTAAQVIQLSTQAIAPIGFDVPKMASIYPTAAAVQSAPFLRFSGGWARAGAEIQPFAEDTSFGDLNGDGLDDAATVVKRATLNGGSEFMLAIMLNQGGVMFNIIDAKLGDHPQVYAHHIEHGQVVLDMKTDEQARTISRYELLGNTLIKVQ